MKPKYASAYTENNDIDNSLKYSIDAERTVDSRKFIEIVEARVEEIVENVWCQVPPDYTDKLLGGFILTGGGMNLKNIERSIRNCTHIDKIRKANFVTQTITSGNADITAKHGDMNTVLGLLAKGDMNCAGPAYNPSQNTLFNNDDVAVGTPADSYAPSAASRQGQGIVPTPEEKKKAEAERRRREEEERKLREEEEARAREIEEEKRRNSFWHKFTRKAKEFGKKIIDEEEE